VSRASKAITSSESWPGDPDSPNARIAYLAGRRDAQRARDLVGQPIRRPYHYLDQLSPDERLTYNATEKATWWHWFLIGWREALSLTL